MYIERAGRIHLCKLSAALKNCVSPKTSLEEFVHVLISGPSDVVLLTNT